METEGLAEWKLWGNGAVRNSETALVLTSFGRFAWSSSENLACWSRIDWCQEKACESLLGPWWVSEEGGECQHRCRTCSHFTWMHSTHTGLLEQICVRKCCYGPCWPNKAWYMQPPAKSNTWLMSQNISFDKFWNLGHLTSFTQIVFWWSMPFQNICICPTHYYSTVCVSHSHNPFSIFAASYIFCMMMWV